MVFQGLIKLGTLSVIAAVIGAAPSSAQDKVTLRIADSFPPGHIIAGATIVPFMDRVKERMGERVELQYYPSEQLGKGQEMLSLLGRGAIDMAFIVPSFTPDKLPRSIVPELPGISPSLCATNTAMQKLAADDGILSELEYKPAGVKALIAFVQPTYQLFMKTEIKDPASIRGRKIYATGAARTALLTDLGAVPTRMGSPEVYEALSRGTIDGVLFAYTSAASYNLQEQLSFGTTTGSFGAGYSFYAINSRTWDGLPDDIRSDLAEIALEVSEEACDNLAEADIKAQEEMQAGGLTIAEISDPDGTIESVSSKVITDWAEELDGRGLDGTKVLEAFRQALPEE